MVSSLSTDPVSGMVSTDPVSGMVLTDLRWNLQLKREILVLASRIANSSPRNTLGTEEYILTREDLSGIDISDQNVLLMRHLDVLREIGSTGQPPESSLGSSLMHGDVDEQMSPQGPGPEPHAAHYTRPIFIFESPKENQPRKIGTVSDSEAHRMGKLTNICRSALLCWLKDEAADNTFQPADSDQLLKAACAFLKREILTADQNSRAKYSRPSRFSRLITHRDNLWSAFQHLRSVPAGEPHTLSIEHLSTKTSRGHA